MPLPARYRERFQFLDAVLVRWEAYGALLSQYGIDPKWAVSGLSGMILTGWIYFGQTWLPIALAADLMGAISLAEILKRSPVAAGLPQASSADRAEARPVPAIEVETDEEAQAKDALAKFVTQKLIPTLEAQVELQIGIVSELSKPNIYLKLFAVSGLINAGGQRRMEQCRVELLSSAIDHIHVSRMQQFIPIIHEVRAHYPAFCAGPSDFVREAKVDYMTHIGLSEKWRKWKRLHNETVEAYEQTCWR